MLAHEAHGVAVVHHYQRIELVGQVAYALEVGYVAVHGEHAVGGDELYLAAGILCVLKLGAKVFHIVVLIAIPLGLAEPHAVYYGGVVQLVGYHGVLGAQQGLEQASVCVEAGGVQYAVVHLYKVGYLMLQLLVQPLGAADEAHGGEAEAPFVIAGLCGLDKLLAVGKAKVVVRAHIEHVLRLGGVYARLLGGSDYAFVLIGAGFPDALEHLAVMLKCGFHMLFLSMLFFIAGFPYFVQSSTTLPLLPLFMASKPLSKSR